MRQLGLFEYQDLKRIYKTGFRMRDIRRKVERQSGRIPDAICPGGMSRRIPNAICPGGK